MQVASIEIARNVLQLEGATSEEFHADAKHRIIHLMEGQKGVQKKGGTMRLGAYPCKVKQGTKTFKAYGNAMVSERHRHRYEFNNDYRERFERSGVIFSGLSPDDHLVEMIELEEHPWFVGCQFHPELKSSPMDPHPLFRDLVKAALEYKKTNR